MVTLRNLDPAVTVLAFDAYGTLLDVHSAVQRLAERIGPDAAAFSAHWRARQLEYTWVLSLAGRHRDFWTLTGEALDHALATFPRVDRALKPALMDAYRQLDAYKEAAATLSGLKRAGYRLCVLSNGSPAMLDDAFRAAGLIDTFEALLSVESVGVFKTAPQVYALVTHRFGVAPAEMALISSNRWDAAGAVAFGARAVWVNRSGAADEYPGLAPLAVIPDLSALA
jgi:2-haloacid dehalogenase